MLIEPAMQKCYNSIINLFPRPLIRATILALNWSVISSITLISLLVRMYFTNIYVLVHVLHFKFCNVQFRTQKCIYFRHQLCLNLKVLYAFIIFLSVINFMLSCIYFSRISKYSTCGRYCMGLEQILFGIISATNGPFSLIYTVSF